jgi:glycosyltransferase involved in cell wall biosynthesis
VDDRVLMMEFGGRGGVADYTQRLVTALVSAGVQVDLATADDHLLDLPAEVRVHAVFGFLRGGTRLRDALRRVRVHKLINAAWFFAGVLRVLPVARRTRLVHVQGYHLPPMFVVTFLLLRAAGARIVHTPHNTFERGSPRQRSRTLMYRLASHIILHTRADLARVPPEFLARTSVIPIPEYGWMAASAAPADRAEVRAQLGLPADAVVFLLFGQMRPDKGVDDLLAALRAVPGAYAILAGEEAGAGSALDGARADPGLRDRVRIIPGFQSIDDTGRWFAAADAAVIPYRVASQSAVLLLAYAFRRPVVAYPVGGLPEVVVDGETGWLCERADVGALADTLREVAAAGPAEAARRGAAGDAYARRELSAETVARKTIEAYGAARAT